MAFSSARTLRAWTGARLAAGTFTNGATDTGGTIDTGIKSIEFAAVQFSSHVDSGNAKISWSGANLTISCNEGADGWWFAVGKV